MNKMTYNTQQTSRGFTIVETLVALTILITIIVGATGAVQTGISSYIYSKDQILAFYFAQEGFEQIRNIRDENRLNNRHWLTGIAQNSSDPCYFGEACTVDPVITPDPINCSSPGNCPVIRQNSNSGLYGYDSSWDATIFTREITLSQVNSDEIAVTVTVSWNKGTQSREFTARENLLNW